MPHASQEGLAIFTSRTGERVYRQPVDILIARTPDAVRPCLDRIEAAVAQGLHAAGFIAYEAAPAFDPALSVHAPDDLPLLWFALYKGIGDPDPEPPAPYELSPWQPCVSKEDYLASVRRVREYIAAGDSYQVNYTFPLRARFRGDPLALYRRLASAQNADFCAYLDTGRFKILSASPELHFRLEGDRLETRPMKGTRRRGRWPEEDRRLAEELADSLKDRAENVMIVDLLRNDMGRISETGSVHVERLFELERYETVWQMTSSIASRTTAPVPDILAALFPSGSVTGAPKARTMQIIREVEPYPRGVYCGSVGWWAPGRRADFNVAIRTVLLDARTGEARYSVGSGITWGSTPEGEYDECLLKAEVLGFRRPEFQLLESILFDGGYFLLEEHLARLESSAEYFGFSHNAEAVRDALAARARDLSAAGGPRKVRLLLSRDGSLRVEDEPAKPAAPLRVGFAKEPVDDSDVFLYHKTTHRTVHARARASRPDCDDVLLWNRRGEVTESTVANVVAILAGQHLTPPVECGLLAGTYRARLLAEGRIREAVLTREDLLRAESVYLINSVRKRIPVELIDPAPDPPR